MSTEPELSVGGLAITEGMEEWIDLPARDLRDTINELAHELCAAQETIQELTDD